MSDEKPTPILCTKTEGGYFYPWPLPRQKDDEHRIHSIFFDDGSVLDSAVGARSANEKDALFYQETARMLREYFPDRKIAA